MFARLYQKTRLGPPEAPRSSWSTAFSSTRRQSTSTGTSRWSPCGPWTVPASGWTKVAPSSRTPCCASPAAKTTTTSGVLAVPCTCLASTSVGTSTFATPGPATVDPWAEVLFFFCSVDILVCHAKMQER